MSKKTKYGTNGSEWISDVITAQDIANYVDGLDIWAGAGNDGVGGSHLHDFLHGEGGNDQLHGYAGNDTLLGGHGDDSAYGGEGHDLISDEYGRNMVYGGNGNDTVWSGSGNDTLAGEGGNDDINDYGGDNTVWLGEGNDVVWLGNGNDTVTGDAGNDAVYAFGGNNTVYLGAGNDYAYVYSGVQFITGDDGHDIVDAFNVSGQIYLGAGNDYLNVEGGSVFVTGDGGDDIITHHTDNNMDTIYAGDGNDTVAIGQFSFTGGVRDIVDGGSGIDSLVIYASYDGFSDAAFQKDFMAYKALMATKPWESYNFDSMGAKVSGFEGIQAEGFLTFENAVALSNGQEQPLTSYGGFTFTQMGVYNPIEGSSLGYKAIGNNLAFFAEAQGFNVDGYPGAAGDPIVMQRADGSDFSLYQGVFSSANVDNLAVSVKGYNNGVLKYEMTLDVSKGQHDYESLGMTGVDKIEFDANNYFGMDDLYVLI